MCQDMSRLLFLYYWVNTRENYIRLKKKDREREREREREEREG